MEKHITPEEVLNKRPLVKIGYEPHYGYQTVIVAMRDYASACAKAAADEAEALYTERIEKVGNELPSEGQFEDWKEINSTKSLDYEGSTVDPTSYQTYEWMKQAASVVIAKEREELNHYKKEYAIIRQLLNAAELTIEQKDKEIVELKESNLKISSEWCNRSAELHKEIYELKTKLDYWIRCKECENRKPMQGSDTCESCALQNHVP